MKALLMAKPRQLSQVIAKPITGNLTQEDFDAAVVAEREEPGSGRPIVDAAANEAARKAKKAVDEDSITMLP